MAGWSSRQFLFSITGRVGGGSLSHAQCIKTTCRFDFAYDRLRILVPSDLVSSRMSSFIAESFCKSLWAISRTSLLQLHQWEITTEGCFVEKVEYGQSSCWSLKA